MMVCYVACYVTKNMNKKYTRKATRVGKRSIAVVIPAELVDELGIREHQKLTLQRSGKKIIIEDWKNNIQLRKKLNLDLILD